MPVKGRVWVDPTGEHWRMRGPELSAKTVRRLLKRQDLRVLHAYGLEPREVVAREHDELLSRLNRFLSGEAPIMSDFRLGDFRNSERQAMLVVQEFC